jgi:hypothetical protein
MKSALLSLIAVMAALSVWTSSAGAQNAPGLTDNTAPGAAPAIQLPSEFLIEPDAQLKGLDIKQKTYRSKTVGQKKAWDLDIGRFQGGYEQDPNRVFEDQDNDAYSGMRLRLPFLGGIKK